MTDSLCAMLKGKRILLIVAGGIAAFKSLELIRRLRERGAAVRCVVTANGARFVHAAVAAGAERGSRLQRHVLAHR